MLSHYFEIQVADNLNPTSMYATILHRLHGFQSAEDSKSLAVDMPKWESPTKFMAARPGNTLRIFGTPEKLSQMLKQTGLFQFLMESGLTIAGIQPVPAHVDRFALLRRSYTVKRCDLMLANPDKIRFDESDAFAANEALIRLASELNCNPLQLARVESVLKRRYEAQAASVVLSMPSKSTGNTMIMELTRTEADFSFNEAGFSSYGLSIKGSVVPTW